MPLPICVNCRVEMRVVNGAGRYRSVGWSSIKENEDGM